MAAVINLVAFTILLAVSYGGSIPGRIVGGKDAKDGAYPHQISIQVTGNGHFCGGSILNEKYILTAAHCTIKLVPSITSVLVGTNSLSSGGVSYEVKTLIHHENYTHNIEGYSVYDIGLIELATPIKFSEKVQPIALPTKDTKPGAELVATGWGLTSYPGSVPDKLQELDVIAVSLKECKETYGEIGVSERELCTFTKKGEGVCRGDSGGPLVEGDVVVGIASRVWEYCATGEPDVFTKVYEFLDWIKENTP